MAFLQPYGTGFGYSAYPHQQYSFAPTAFASAAHEQAAQADGSQAGEEHASQQVSVSGFAADPNAALWGGAYGAPAWGGAYGGFGQHTFLPNTSLVRRPGYNERLVAWRNRQKAFNRYKRATKEAIKNANRQAAWQQGFGYGGAHTAFGHPGMFGAPYGATFLPGAGFVYDQSASAQNGAYPTFGDFSQGGASQHQEAAEEPEIRGTQV